MDYTRQRDWFDPDTTDASVTIVGCGGIGSFTAFALAKLGVQDLKLLDFDFVEEHNVPNQLYRPGNASETHPILKVRALGATVFDHTGIVPSVHAIPLQDGVPLSDVVISALDSMEARADLWQQVKYKLACKLFIDARLGGENIVVYSLNPSVPSEIAGYEATLHSDEEGLDLPCTGRSIIDVGFSVAALITRAVRRFYAGSEPEAQVYLNQANLELFKGGWA